ASSGMKFAMIVTLSGVVGLTNAYRSVLSASGSWLMSGASRWLDARSGLRNAPAVTNASTTQASFLTEHLLLRLRRKRAIGCVNERGKGLGGRGKCWSRHKAEGTRD